MPISREYAATVEDGQPEHLLVRVSKGKGGHRCFCNHGYPVILKHTRIIDVAQHLTCTQCNDELRRWEQFWSKQEGAVQ